MKKSKGQVLGIHLRSVIRALPTSQVELPEYRKTVDAMDPAEWYDWDLYVRMTHEIAARLPSEALVAIGRRIIHRGKDLFAAQGFDSLDKVFRKVQVIFASNSRGISQEDRIRIEHYEPGHFIIETGEAHVPELIEGYMRGFVEAYGGSVLSFSGSLTKSSPPRYRYEMRYDPKLSPST